MFWWYLWEACPFLNNKGGVDGHWVEQKGGGGRDLEWRKGGEIVVG